MSLCCGTNNLLRDAAAVAFEVVGMPCFFASDAAPDAAVADSDATAAADVANAAAPNLLVAELLATWDDDGPEVDGRRDDAAAAAEVDGSRDDAAEVDGRETVAEIVIFLEVEGWIFAIVALAPLELETPFFPACPKDCWAEVDVAPEVDGRRDDAAEADGRETVACNTLEVDGRGVAADAAEEVDGRGIAAAEEEVDGRGFFAAAASE